MKAEDRRDKRNSVLLTAMLRSADGEAEVKLTNLSSLGACADYPVLLAVGTEIELSRGGLAVKGRIAWAVAGKVGIQFAEPLNLPEFRKQGQNSTTLPIAALHKPVEKLSPRLERSWTKILSQ